MDEKGHLIITNAEGKETFRGKSFRENGLEERALNRHDRRAQAAIDRLEEKVRTLSAQLQPHQPESSENKTR